MGEKILSFRELKVYQLALESTMKIFRLTKNFPKEEKYSLTDQILRSSRSVCANIAEAWRKRKYRAAFVAKLNDAEAEACETQVWLDVALKSHYIDENAYSELDDKYDHIISQLVRMADDAGNWTITRLK